MNRRAGRWNTKDVTMMGVLVALSVVAGRRLVLSVSQSLRGSTAHPFVTLGGLGGGPAGGAGIGALQDLLGCVLGGQAPYLPLTLSPMLAGFASGLLGPAFSRHRSLLFYGLCVAGISFFTTFLYSSWCLASLYGSSFLSMALPRAPLTAVLAVVNTLVVWDVNRGPVRKVLREERAERGDGQKTKKEQRKQKDRASGTPTEERHDIRGSDCVHQ